MTRIMDAMTAVYALLVQLALAALGVLLAVAFAVGAAVAAHPPLLARLRRGADRRVSMRRATRALDIPRNVDHWFYRHHRTYGAGVALLALVLLGFLTFGSAPEAWARAFGPAYRDVAGILVDTARLVLWLFGVLALVVGVVVFVRPSALKGLEAKANRWVTPRRALRGLEREYDHAETWMARYPRAWGVTIAAVCGLCLLALVLHAGAIARLAG